MKKEILNKIVEVVSVYYAIDLFQVIEASELLFFTIKTHFKKSKP
ncbi:MULTISPECIES: hypothetical protein [unclassified Flavobacterium]|nr:MULTISPECIES: hypothetical protein [unclassified Flavobacterium]